MTAQKNKITLDGQTVAYTLKRSDKAKYARLEVGTDSGLTVIVPAYYSSDRLRTLLLRKRRWIVQKLEKYGLNEVRHGRARLKAGDVLPYLGKNMSIERGDGADKGGSVHLSRTSIVVCLPPGDNKLHLPVERWYRTQAARMIGPMVDRISLQMGLPYNRVTVKGQKSLWASCSRKRNLNFNWRLMMTPEQVIEYVVIHELAHLSEMNHSIRFWQIVERQCPAWKEHRRWLRTHSQELNHMLPA